ncbi:hypothetical protein JW916_12510 [Candidatus Sumerlaeota bacterium]|nr:hypothetical protein [Candidatus Sumerlaeota bacterium]
MTTSRTLACTSIFLVVVLCAAGCGRPEEGGEGGASAGSSSGGGDSKSGGPQSAPEANPHGFESDLLLSDARTAQFMVEMPTIEGRLSDATPYVAQVQLIVECANSETRDEVETKKETLATTLQTLLSEKNLAFISSTSGKIQFQEEAVERVKRRLTHQGVKQIHYIHFAIERSR